MDGDAGFEEVRGLVQVPWLAKGRPRGYLWPLGWTSQKGHPCQSESEDGDMTEDGRVRAGENRGSPSGMARSGVENTEALTRQRLRHLHGDWAEVAGQQGRDVSGFRHG